MTEPAVIPEPAVSELALALAGRAGRPGSPTVLDIGGGSGTEAVPWALTGARVTVVDRSIDALAILRRRAQDAGVADRVTGVQADAEQLGSVVPAGSFQAVLVHQLLDRVEDGDQVLRAAVTALAPGGSISVIVASRYAAVADHLRHGRSRQALAVLRSERGIYGADDPLTRRFTAPELQDLLRRHGLEPVLLLGSDPERGLGAERVLAEADLQQDPVLREFATNLQVVAERREDRTE